MHDLSDLLVVLPAYNEEETVASVVEEVKLHLPGARCLVVDDASSDDTAGEARRAGAHVVRLPFNLGVGGAMRTGFRYATENGFSRVVQVDADGQHDPRSVLQMLEALGDTDIVIGARFAGEGSYRVAGPRKWAMVLLAKTLSAAARTPLTDTTSGLRAAGPRAVRLFAREYPAEYLGDTIESLVIAMRRGLNITQVPVSMRARQGGVASQNAARSTIFLVRAIIALAVAFTVPKVDQA